MFFCEECFNSLIPPVTKKSFKKCNVKCICGKEYNLTTESSNYVIALDLKYHLELLFKDEEIKTALLENIRKINLRKNKSGKIKDFTMGYYIKNCEKNILI